MAKTAQSASKIGKKIRDARTAAGGMTQDGLAFAVWRVTNNKITPTGTDISRYERGKHLPRAEMVAAIAKATGHPLEFFLSETEEADPDEETALAGIAQKVLALGHYDLAEDLVRLALMAKNRKAAEALAL